MASIESVRASIDANVKTNGQQKITGSVLNSVLNDMVDLSEQTEGKVTEQGGVLSELVPNVETQGETLTEQGKQIATLSKGLTEQGKNIENLDKAKANQDGKYPELTAGFATNLVGRGEAVDATINFRPSGGTSIEDGAARVKELKGNSVVWNQLTRNPQFNTWDGWNVDGTRVSADGVAVITANSSVTGVFQTLSKAMANHIYFLSAKVKTSVATAVYVYLGTNIYNGLRGDTDGSTFTNISGICSNIDMTHPVYQCSAYIAAGETMSIKDMIFIDLTQMFGAGNEPTSVEEFYNRIPQNVDLYAYNEGEIVSTNAEGIKSVGFNAWDEEWEMGTIDTDGSIVSGSNVVASNLIPVISGYQYCINSTYIRMIAGYDSSKNLAIMSLPFRDQGGIAIFDIPLGISYIRFETYGYGSTYNHDICINLAHSGYRNGEYQPYMQFIRDIDPRIREAFPNGMRSAGNASDEIRWNSKKETWEAVKRIGAIDLGTLDWVYEGMQGSYVFMSWQKSKGIGIKDTNNGMCSRYIHVSTKDIIYVDGHIDIYSKWYYEDGNIIIHDSRYSDPNELKNTLNGVMLYYELAEPIITELGNDINLDYEVWDFGTEQMIATEPSAPIKASIVYGFNAVDSVRTAQLEIAELKTQIAQMQAIMASITAQPAMIDIPTYNI